MEEIKIYKSVDEWRREGERRFGNDIMKVKFKCPMCGHVASVQDFKDAGAKSADCAYTECLGRYKGKGSPKKNDHSGCNWCAYGLFGIPKGGVYVINNNEKIHIFDYADSEEGEDNEYKKS